MESLQKRPYAVIACLFIVLGGFTFYAMNNKEDVWNQVLEISTDGVESIIDSELIAVDSPGLINSINHGIIGTNIDRIRTAEGKLSALDQFIKGSGEMVMFHYSGGCESTLKEWFTRIRTKLLKLHRNEYPDWNSSIQHIEITHDFHESFGMSISEYIRSNPSTMVLLCFGSPIKRILAQYDKEWRWGCPKEEGTRKVSAVEQVDSSELQ